MAADIIVFANQKGGVGKTITVSATASILHSRGKRVLMINLDAQRNLDMVAGDHIAISRSDTSQKNIMTVLNGECELRDAIVSTNIGDLARATNQLYAWTGIDLITEEEFEERENDPAAVMELLRRRIKLKKNTDAHILEKKLQAVLDDYDYILIDTNPTLTLLTTNALYAANYVVIPAFSERSSAEAVIELYESIQSIKYFNPGKKLEILGLLMTKFDPRSRAGKRHIEAYQAMTKQMGIHLFEAKIRVSARAAEYVEAGEDIVNYDPTGNTTQDYNQFVDELIKEIAKHKEVTT